MGPRPQPQQQQQLVLHQSPLYHPQQRHALCVSPPSSGLVARCWVGRQPLKSAHTDAYSSARGGAFFARAWLSLGESVLEVHFWVIFVTSCLPGPLGRASWKSFCVLGWLLLMMHYPASIASLASPDPIFTAFLTLALERSPHQAPGSPPQTVPFRTLPPHTPLTHFVRSKNSSLAYRLAFVMYIYIYMYGYYSIYI